MSMSSEERQIKEAFIDGFMAAHMDGDAHRAEAERAWRTQNTTDRVPPRRAAVTVVVPARALRLVVEGGAPDQATLDNAVGRLRLALG